MKSVCKTGQETREAVRDVESVDIDLLLSTIYTAKSVAGLPTKNILKGFQHLISGLKIGKRLRDAYENVLRNRNDKDLKILVDSCVDCKRYYNHFTGKSVYLKPNEVDVVKTIDVIYHTNPENYNK